MEASGSERSEGKASRVGIAPVRDLGKQGVV